MRVGVAGLGRMGAHMARNLAAAGYELTVWNRSPDRARALADETGCAVAQTPRALAAATDVVVTMLADDASSEAVHLGADGLFAGSGARVFVEMGTMSPDHIAALAQAAPAGCTVIDAPVSGATQAAADAQLLIMAGCSPDTAAPLMALFDAMGRKTICLGRPGAGAVMKLAVNSLIHGLNQTLAEAMTLAEASGIAPEAAFDVIENSAAAAPMLKYRRPLYLDEAAHDVTFTVALARKDMEVTAALARDLGAAMPQGEITLSVLRDAEAQGYAARDMAAILNFMREDST
ncbi:3-hydroxyisobutyrate dehydrogenase [Cribrihabitans marinus]|uniref:3-hydroxyisobutyrate dehydrogenase n=2 Tax=Cribrihabitans marinus TaxID=1227549 RepID=A0A1H7BBM3_9RHOB|nr:NAD(P)-dependent oxidoreductase [Cribrihabitans marinus]GGH33042.1 3-hydroxyisobutyrate dehydrogenase [Cribrihabitans marinus]SEJ71720.1 3-hydroxyisobutyrate dehydrogenase [Cribrihabitans marinus]